MKLPMFDLLFVVVGGVVTVVFIVFNQAMGRRGAIKMNTQTCDGRCGTNVCMFSPIKIKKIVHTPNRVKH